MNNNNKRERNEYENDNENKDNSIKKINSSSSSSNSSSTSQIIKLNSLVFNDILPLLLYECKFERLLELSLISKSTFKSVQNYVTHKQNEIKFYPKYDQLLKYIIKTSTFINSNNNNNNEFKLFKFNEISNLYINKKESFKSVWGYIDLKKELIKYRGDGLKKVYFPNYHHLLDTYDLYPTLNGFFQFNKLYNTWEQDEPESIGDDHKDQDYYENRFSFEFLNTFNPKKYKFSTSYGCLALHLKKLNNILNCKSLESIKFDYHNTYDQEFIVNAISSKSPQIKELTVRPETGLLSNCFNKSNIANNKTLSKLVLRRQVVLSPSDKVNVRTSNDINDPNLALQQLIGNTSIRILGLELYRLIKDEDYKLLSPLIQIPTINEIYCDLDSTIQFLLHCNQNSNINVLHIKNYQNEENGDKKDDDILLNLIEMIEPICNYFSTFILQNQSLECIKITACHDLYDRLIEILNQSNNKNNLIIKKFRNGQYI